MAPRYLQIFGEWTKALIIAFVLAMFIRFFLVQAFKIPSGSMLDTLQIGDHLLVLKTAYAVKVPFTHVTIFSTGHPDYGDVIVFEHPTEGKDYIKRVIGRPGDVIEIRDKQVFRNGELVIEPYVRHSDSNIYDNRRDNFGPITVDENCYFVLGDNRDVSRDSRYWGLVDESLIRGRAWLVYWSWNASFHVLDWPWRWRFTIRDIRWSRMGFLVR